MKKSFFLILAFVIWVSGYSQQSGTVVSIADGDTFTFLTIEKKQIRVRLHGIDCPEKAQDFGQVAKQFLSDLIYSKTVTVIVTETDRYGRSIGKVFVDSVCINEELLRAGLAWHYKQYDKSQRLASLEAEARKNKKGLWVRSDAIAPWDFRKRK